MYIMLVLYIASFIFGLLFPFIMVDLNILGGKEYTWISFLAGFIFLLMASRASYLYLRGPQTS